MIDGLLFLHHLCLYNNHLQSLLLSNIYCDNKGLVKKVHKICSFRLASASAVLHSEYNVLAPIHSLLAGLPNPPVIAHVKGHQDNKIKYHNLPLPSQLNCDANVFATGKLAEYQTTCQTLAAASSSESPALPWQLHSNSKPASHHFPSTWSPPPQNLHVPTLPLVE